MSQIAFIFPGQGSQSTNMLSEMRTDPQVAAVFTEAADVLGYDLWEVINDADNTRLNQTIFTQPIMLAADIALWRWWCHRAEARPAVVAGHSLGEFAALVAAEVISLEDALSLVRSRAESMQSAADAGDGGAMAAILKMSDQDVRALCDEVALESEVLSPANFNCPGQVVIAGKTDAVLRAIDKAKADGARAIRLPVSIPAHCGLMSQAEIPFRTRLDSITGWKNPKLPLLHNADLCICSEVTDIKDQLVKQLTHSVKWTQTMNTISDNYDVNVVVECGPGAVLKGLGRKINPDVKVLALSNQADREMAISLVGE